MKNELEAIRQELDKERRKNRELQAKVDALHIDDDQIVLIPRIELVSLQVQLVDMKRLVEALTAGRPAMNAVVNAKLSHSNTHLPLHVTRFLEIMPWHPIAQQASCVTEELYEWQVYCPKKKTWKSELSFFPAFFKALPVVQPSKNGHPVDQTSKHGVYTNHNPTQRHDLTQGYFLPNHDKTKGPVWKWIGPWKVHLENRIVQQSPLLHDPQGWAYANEAGHFQDTQHLIDPQSIPLRNDSQLTNPLLLRRRRWTRTRVLVDYPLASEPTVQYLSIQANQKILQAQLHKAQRKLQETQAQYQLEQEEWIKQNRLLEQRVKDIEQQQQHVLWQRQKGPSMLHFARIHDLPVQHKNDGKPNNESLDTINSSRTGHSDHGTIAGALQHLDRIFHNHHIPFEAAGAVPEVEPCSDDNNSHSTDEGDGDTSACPSEHHGHHDDKIHCLKQSLPFIQRSIKDESNHRKETHKSFLYFFSSSHETIT